MALFKLFTAALWRGGLPAVQSKPVDMGKRSDKYSELRVKEVKEFRYVEYTVISTDPESDAIERVYKYAKET